MEKIIVKGDQEPAIHDLMREIARARGNVETLIEHSPVRDSSGNGIAERGVQTLECMVRTHILELDDKLGEKLPLNLPWFSWLIEHCADIHNRHQVGMDGRTPYGHSRARRAGADSASPSCAACPSSRAGRRTAHPTMTRVARAR